MLIYDGNQVIFLFGLGLVGRAIDAELSAPSRFVPYDWIDKDQRSFALERLRKSVGRASEVQIVWAAGRSGFNATQDEVNKETDLLTEIVEFAVDLVKQDHNVVFHHVSSAGGLFEGQSNVSVNSTPRPLRPYGTAKQKQEEILIRNSELWNFKTSIYRPSSVYGFCETGRAGLITNLLANTLFDRETLLFGELETRRDYVFVQDIGRFIAKQIKFSRGFETPALLASGNAESIAAVIDKIEKISGRKPKLKQQDIITNGSDMSFEKASLPDAFDVTELKNGIAICFQEMKAFYAKLSLGSN